jgi:hypothetical protein
MCSGDEGARGIELRGRRLDEGTVVQAAGHPEEQTRLPARQ